MVLSHDIWETEIATLNTNKSLGRYKGTFVTAGTRIRIMTLIFAMRFIYNYNLYYKMIEIQWSPAAFN